VLLVQSAAETPVRLDPLGLLQILALIASLQLILGLFQWFRT